MELIKDFPDITEAFENLEALSYFYDKFLKKIIKQLFKNPISRT